MLASDGLLPKYNQQKRSAHLRFGLISVLTRNRCIYFYISLFTEIILQKMMEFQTEIQGSLTKLSVFKKCLIVTLQKWQNYQ